MRTKKNNFDVDLASLRKRHNMNQTEFWKKIGVTQSGGSRYESGRRPAPPVMKLIRLAYGTKAEQARERKELGIE